MAEKKCSKCKKLQPLTSFYKSIKAKDGLQNQCKDCGRATPRSSSMKNFPCLYCERPARTRKMCGRHYNRWLETGTASPEIPLRTGGKGWVDASGYRVVHNRTHPNARKNGKIFEHTLVMTEFLGRSLFPEENIHHKNGNRLDNRIENLELWSKRQPAGQRVEDKVAWAIEILRLYRPEALAECSQGN